MQALSSLFSECLLLTECEGLQRGIGHVTPADDVLTSQNVGVNSPLHCCTQSDSVAAAEQLLYGHYFFIIFGPEGGSQKATL